MKKTALITILIILSVSMAFANGNKDNATTGEIELEKITVTGPINFTGFRGEVSIEEGGITYYLMYPHHIDTDIDLSEGESVTVEGYLFETDDTQKILHVTKAVIRGEEYDLEKEFGYGFMGGQGGCWMIDEFEDGEFPEGFKAEMHMFKGRRGGRGGRGHMRF